MGINIDDVLSDGKVALQYGVSILIDAYFQMQELLIVQVALWLDLD